MNARNFKFKATSADKKRFMRLLHKFLNNDNCDIRLGWSKKHHGVYSWVNDVIYINICYFIASVLIHEFLHMKHSSFLSEDEIKKSEKEIFRSLSDCQIRNLAMKVMIGRKITEQDFKQIPDD